MLYVVENGCKWRSLPKEYGNWHVIYVRVNRWAKKGVLQAVFLRLQQLGIIQIQVNVVSLDSTCIKVHPDGMGALKKVAPSLSEEHRADGTPNFIKKLSALNDYQVPVLNQILIFAETKQPCSAQ